MGDGHLSLTIKISDQGSFCSRLLLTFKRDAPVCFPAMSIELISTRRLRVAILILWSPWSYHYGLRTLEPQDDLTGPSMLSNTTYALGNAVRTPGKEGWRDLCCPHYTHDQMVWPC